MVIPSNLTGTGSNVLMKSASGILTIF